LTSTPERRGLLGTDDPPPFVLLNAAGRSPFLLIGDHAGNRMPGALGTLGLTSADRERHIAWDIGVLGLGTMLAQRLDAPFLHQRYSRLVVDCNRDPASIEAMPAMADGSAVPGNVALDSVARAARIAAIHTPYHRAISAMLDRRAADGVETVLVSLHSFTPVLSGQARPWDAGVLHWAGDSRFARRLLAILQRDAAIITGDNQPYRMDATDYTIPHHAFPRQLAYVELEIRQDLIGDAAGQHQWAARLADALAAANLPS